MATQFVATPQQYGYAVAPAQTFDFNSIINMIIPIMGLVMLMGVLTPLMKGMSKGFSD